MLMRNRIRCLFLAISLYLTGTWGLAQIVRNKAADAPQTAPLKADSSRPTEVLSRVEPEYPPEVLRVGLRGVVRCQLIVNERGIVYEAKALVGHPWMRKPALNAVVQWKFKPLLVDGIPKPFVVLVTVSLNR
ncbi:MAG: energy transducer TonB [Acidobacteriia bacterium]|nr:energy transducer TonB [Terriglobia bacterium]